MQGMDRMNKQEFTVSSETKFDTFDYGVVNGFGLLRPAHKEQNTHFRCFWHSERMWLL